MQLPIDDLMLQTYRHCRKLFRLGIHVHSKDNANWVVAPLSPCRLVSGDMPVWSKCIDAYPESCATVEMARESMAI